MIAIFSRFCSPEALKASSFIIPLTSAGYSEFHSSVSLFKSIESMFSVCGSSFIWTIAANATFCKRIDRK